MTATTRLPAHLCSPELKILFSNTIVKNHHHVSKPTSIISIVIYTLFQSSRIPITTTSTIP